VLYQFLKWGKLFFFHQPIVLRTKGARSRNMLCGYGGLQTTLASWSMLEHTYECEGDEVLKAGGKVRFLL
jgi:hypothetical protein